MKDEACCAGGRGVDGVGAAALDLAVREEGGQLLLEILASGSAILFR